MLNALPSPGKMLFANSGGSHLPMDLQASRNMGTVRTTAQPA